MNRITITHLVLALGLLIASVVLMVGMELSLDASRTKEIEIEKEIVHKQSETARLSTEKETLPILESSETTLRQYSVNADDIVPFLNELEKKGKAQGATVEVLSVSNDAGGKPRILLSLHIVGTFEAVERTLGVIEYGPYDAVFSSVTLDTASEKSAKVPQWSAGAVLSVSAVSTKPAPKK